MTRSTFRGGRLLRSVAEAERRRWNARAPASSVALGLGLLAATSISSSCAKDPTQLVVVVDSDLDAPTALAEVRVRFPERSAEAKLTRRIVPAGAPLGNGEAALPFSFGIAPVDGDPSIPIKVEVDAVSPSGGVSFTRTAVVRLARGRSALLGMFLAHRCVAEAARCKRPNETCTENGCVLPNVDAESLPEVTPGGEFGTVSPATSDAGPRADAGDAGRSDGGDTSSHCGDGRTDPAKGEDCDDGNATTEPCPYGERSCIVCGALCKDTGGTTSFCGDGRTDPSNAEACDDGNTIWESCAYGQPSCTVCNFVCRIVAGDTSYCGDGSIDAANGESCDDGNTRSGDGCSASCRAERG